MTALGFLDRQHTIAPVGYNRWLIPPAALAIHLCIGQAYATSVYKASLVAHFDTNLTKIGVIFSIAIVMLGLSAAVFGKWVDHGGPRKAMFAAACCWATGFVIGSIGIHTSQLWLVYLGYGFIGGCGLGIGYISPVSTLMKWFPDRPGMATGMAIMGFGGGAMIASPLMVELLDRYNGGGPDPKTLTYSGDSVAKMFLTLAIVYFAVMMFGVFTVKVPAPGWKPAGWEPTMAHAKPMIATGHVSADNAIKTPQFWFLWLVLMCNVTAGIGLLEQASFMIQDFFRHGDVSAVNVAQAAGFVGLLSMFNMAGRFVWSTTSDLIGRKRIYMMYLGIGVIAYTLLALFGGNSTAIFVVLAMVIVSFYGGGFATVPAYLRDLFGTFEVGAIHGRLLTAWSTAGVLGPLIINRLLDAQGEPGTLGAANYRTALFTMVCILAVGFVANLLIRPVNARWHEPDDSVDVLANAH